MVYYIIAFVILIAYFAYTIGKGNARDTELRLQKIKDLHKRKTIKTQRNSFKKGFRGYEKFSEHNANNF